MLKNLSNAVGLSVLLISAVCVEAQSQTPVVAPAKGLVQGDMIASDTNQAIAGAAVELRVQPSGRVIQAITGKNGEFVIAGLPPAEYIVTAHRIGYGPVNYSVTTPKGRRAILPVKAGTAQSVHFRLMPLGALEGLISGTDGAPLNGARVMLSRYRSVGGQRILVPERDVPTATDGTFRMTAVPSGEYLLSAFSRSTQLYAPRYLPGLPSPRGAQTVNVTLGQTVRGIQLQLAPAPAFAIRGLIVDPVGNPLPGAVVVARREMEDGSWSLVSSDSVTAKSGMTGEFLLPKLLAGNYRLLVSGTLQGAKLGAHTAVTVGSQDTTNVTLAAAPQAVVTGRVILVDGKDNKIDPRAARISLYSELNAGSPELGRSAVAEDGTFRIDGILDGLARFEATMVTDRFYVKSIRRNGQEIAGHALNIVRGEQIDGIEVVISLAPAQLTGTVAAEIGEKGVRSPAVLMFPADPELRRTRPDLIKRVGVSQNGEFTVRGIAPGSYRVTALRNLAADTETGPTLLAAVESEAVSVVVTAGKLQTQVLQAVNAPSR